ncbi:CHASE2 domain-containing protein [Calothrix sp. UHCC 0171]|uniref:CHASE2 domain-containing protein n=1 Tax=Calothrix sp. UHCC 0171 TaxID=3110245 RepID=UPI002B21D889|nr:CHASE2 domain-containing protein [Calothrix sp. UHCC 0171]MEA5570511.1 CHASE2 domain-containing protein [Calothrix sp. UHCC 0171]
MHRLIILNLGKGDLQNGFLNVTAQFWESEELTPMQFVGSLPANQNLNFLYQQWLLLYESLYANLAWRRTRNIHPEFEIDEDDSEVSHISHAEFAEVSQNLQIQLNRWLSTDSFLTIDRKLRTHLTPKDEIRLLIVAQDANILKLPWCLWDFLSDYPQAEIALSPPEYARSLKAVNQAKKKIKILSILGNSHGIDIVQDQKILKQLPDAEITFLIEPTLEQLNEKLWQAEWDILFFAGHSSSQGKGCMQINATDTFTIEQLKYGLRKAISHDLKLAIFNSCDGLGLAQDLADLHLPQVIVMREPVPDKVAQEFLKHFLAAFSGGKSLYLSVREAREKLQGLEVEFPCATWLPVICQNPAESPSSWWEWCGKKQPIQLLPNRRELRLILVSSLVSTLFIAGIRFLGLLSPIELFAFDMLMRIRMPEKPDDRLLIVTVTPEDIQAQDAEPRFGSLSDTTLSKVLQKLEQHQPVAIGLDIYRDYPSRKPELIQQLQSQRLIGICKRPDAKDDPTGTLPPPEIKESRLGFSDFVQDDDGIIRRHLLFMTPNTTSRCTAAYAFNTQLAFRYLYTQGIKPEFTPEGNIKLRQKVFSSIENRTGGYQSIDASGSQVLLNYRAMSDPQAIAQRVTLKDIFSNKVNPKAIQNRIVLIGIADLSAGDYWSTPYGAGSSHKIPGVLVHAHMLSQILSYVLDERPLLWVWSSFGELGWIASWALFGGFIAWRFHRLMIMGIVLLTSVIILSLTCFIFINYGGWIPLVAPAIALLLTNGAVVLVILSNNQYATTPSKQATV